MEEWLSVEVVFWVMTQCSDMVGCQCFAVPCCLQLHPEDHDMKSSSPWEAQVTSEK